MKLKEKKVFLPPERGRSVFPGPVTYIDSEKAYLMMWYGYIDHSDAFDDWVEIVSTDNGLTWSKPVHRFRGSPVEKGKIRYAEPVLFYDPDRHNLTGIIKKGFYPGDKRMQEVIWELVIKKFDFMSSAWDDGITTTLGYPEGVATSFSFPRKLSSGRILVPLQKGIYNAEIGSFIHHKDYWSRAYQALAMIGQYSENGSIAWRAGQPNPVNLELSCRGQCEPAFAELKDGRIAGICRGDNGAFPEKPGYKWLILSSDQGETWSDPKPVPCTDGTMVESPSSGSALFRSIKDGCLYWIGNLCVLGERPNANWPRNPLIITRFDEDKLAFCRETISIIDRTGEKDGPRTQLSNFKYYQDRENGDVVLFMTRFGENGTEQDPAGLSQSNCCRYRIEI